MNKLAQLYKEHVYGIIGTLIFHILLLSSFLLADVNLKGEAKEEPVVIEFFAEEETLPEIEEENTEDENTPSQKDQPTSNNRSNRAVNDAAPAKDPFFNEAYRQEIEEAQKLVADVNKQLSKKIPDIKQFEMPEETTEGLHPDSIKNTIYSGESNIHYSLKNPIRYHRRLPVPVYLAHGGGTVTVDIWVSPEGKVIKAEVQSGGRFSDPLLPEYARQAASRTIFNKDLSAPSPQKGTITYTFVPQ